MRYSKTECPSKTFLVGEYAVLTGGPALVMTTPPYFSSDSDGFYDPYDGLGGFGASGAKFVLSAKNNGMTNPWKVWELYKKQGLSGSGADVISQWMGGLVFFHATQKILEIMPWPFEDLYIGLIHTGQKIETHHYLDTLELKPYPLLDKRVLDSYESLKNKDKNNFIKNIIDYKYNLKALKLITEYSENILKKLDAVPDLVLASKGCGAMGSDVILVIIDKKNKINFKKFCEDNTLNLLYCHNQFAKGVSQYD